MRVMFPAVCALTAMLVSQTAMAAQDSGYVMTGTPPIGTGRSIGAQLGLTIKFGDGNAVPESDKVRVDLAAGPLIHYRTVSGFKRTQPNFVSLTLNPRRTLALTLAGQPLATHVTALGAAEREDDGDKKDRKGPSTLGWVAIGVGALVVGTLVVGYAALTDCPCD